GPALPAATRLPRGDTVGACGNDGRNGWLIQYNYNLLGDGPHSVVVRQGGTPFASASFEVTTLGETFLRGRRALFDLPIFGSDRVTLEWSEAVQGFVIVGAEPATYLPYRDVLEQVSALGPLYTTGGPLVRSHALDEAARLLAAMLAHRP